MKKLIDIILKPGGDLTNNVVKAILIGLIAGVFIGFIGNYVYIYKAIKYNWRYDLYEEFYPEQAIIGGIIVSLLLFLRYNKKD